MNKRTKNTFIVLICFSILFAIFAFCYKNGKKILTEESAARAVFHSIFPEFDDNIMIVVPNADGYSSYEYQSVVDEMNNAIERLTCGGLSQDKSYYIFGYYIYYYNLNQKGEREYYYFNFYSNYAVNRKTGEVIQERMWSDETCEWIYNSEYEKIVILINN